MEYLHLLEHILDKSSDIICFFDSEGSIRFMNQTGTRELDYPDGSVNIRDILRQFIPRDADIFKFTEDNSGGDIRTEAYRRNHSCFPVRLNIFLLDGIFPEKWGIVFMSDVRSLDAQEKNNRNLEEQIAEVMRAQDEFTANLTHELRTPVNGIKGHINNLKESEDDIVKRRTYDIVLKCCETMEKIINNLLDFAKLENGKMVIESLPFSLHSLIKTSVDVCEGVANQKGLDLICQIADDVPDEVLGDEFHLSQVINNLLNNALKFTSTGSVTLEVYRTGANDNDLELTFFVRDTGIGMSLEDKDKLFKSFSQVDGSITRKYGGTGLGLYVCKQIVELMGGHIDIESESGKGTTFIFTVNMKTPGAADDSVEDGILLSDGAASSEGSDETYVIPSQTIKKPLDYDVISDLLEKCSICIELENWEKAESFSSTIKDLVDEADSDFSKTALRLALNCRKEKKDKSREYITQFEDEIHQALKAGDFS